MDGAALIGIVKKGSLSGLIVLDGDAVPKGQLDGVLVGDGGGPGDPADKGKGPVIAVIGEAQKQLFRRDLRHGIVQHRPDIRQRRDGHGRTRSVPPLIGHHQDAVRGGTDGGIVVPLVQRAGLLRGGLGGQRRPEKEAVGVHHPPQPAQESRVGGGQVAREELKVHIQAGVAPAQEELTELLRQPVLRGRIRQHQSGPLGVELPVFRQGGQVHHRTGAPLPGGGEQRIGLQRQKAAGGGDAVGEGRETGEVGELRIQQSPVDEGVGIAVEDGGCPGLVPIGDHQRLPGKQLLASPQVPVVLPQLPYRGAMGGRDGGQSLAGPDHMKLLGKADHQRLPDRHGAVRRDCVVRSQPPGVHAVRRRDGADGLASLDHMDRHETSPLGTSLCGGECGYASRETA